MNKRLIFLLTPAALLGQIGGAVAIRPLRSAPGIEFTGTSNASQVGVSLVLGCRFTVRTPVILTSLGAVLQGGGSTPTFGALPASMPVGLWDDGGNLLVSATVSASDPLTGHFNYRQVANTPLSPGVGYTIAGLVTPGRSVLSDVPGMTTGSEINFESARSFASQTLAFPAADALALRRNYFGAGFAYTGARAPVAFPGRDRSVVSGAAVQLDGSGSFSEAGGPISWAWELVSKPAGSKAELAGGDSSAPSFTPDAAGLYVARLVVSDASARSRPSTVSIAAEPAVKQ